MTKKQSALLVLFSFFSFNIYAQKINCDTLAQEVLDVLYNYSRKAPEEVRKDYNLLKDSIPSECLIANVYIKMIASRINIDTGNTILALENLDDALLIADQTLNNTIRKDIIKLSATIYSDNGKQQKAIDFVDQALDIPCHADSTKCIEANVPLMINKGLYLSLLDDYNGAIKVYTTADSLIEAQNHKNPLYRVVINSTLGNIHTNQSDNFKEALKSFKKALHHCPTDHFFKTMILSNIAATYKELGEIDSTRVIIKQVINSTDSPARLISPYQILGLIELDSSNYSLAIDNFKTALSYANISGAEQRVIKSKNLLSQAYYHAGKYKEAAPLLKEVNEFYRNLSSQQSNMLDVEKYTNLNAIALLNPSISKSMHNYLIKYDSLYGEERMENLDKLVYKYENKIVSDSLASIKLVANNQSLMVKNQRLSIFSLISALLASILSIFFIFRRLKTAKAKNEELVFKNQELESINQQLEKKTRTIENKVVADVKGVPSKVQFKSADKVYLLELEQIKYVQAEDDGTRVFYEDTSNWTDASLKEMSKQLPQDSFVQIFRSTIVNINHIGWVNTTSLKMKDGTELKISRTYKQRIKDVIKE